MENPERAALVQVPPARVRLLPYVVIGLALWTVGLVVVLVADLGATARDVALAGIGFGGLLAWWAHRMDRRLR